MMKNKGYTLIELIIVMTITVILSAGTFVVIGIMREAKRQSATNTLNNQISSCLIKTKAVSNATNGTDKPLCMVIAKRSDGAYAVMTGYYDIGTNTVVNGSGALMNPDVDGNCDVILPKEIKKIEYKEPDSDTTQISPANGNNKVTAVIQFIKSYGSTKYGGGSYKLYSNDTDVYATIYLDPVSGKHYVK